MFKTQFNVQPYEGAENTLPSETLEDQAIPLTELVTRYLAGEPVYGTVRYLDSQIDDVDYPIDDELLFENPDFFRAHEIMQEQNVKCLKLNNYESNQHNYQSSRDDSDDSTSNQADPSGEEQE